ncbi:MAG TPA: FAD:protein FMN transferase [Candidatus Saccharimonadales bacterium]|nr:FAD:protein FMN transferase [Candidatus Saccharimonadales bacterium]
MRRYQQTKHALGSTAYMTIVLADDASPDQLFEALWQHIARFEQRFSRFLPDSELTAFNAAAGERQSVSPEFRELLVTARTMSEKTEGLYNPFILPALQRAGYKGSWPKPELADEKLNYEKRSEAAWSSIEIGDSWAAIPKNTALDFGGIGKGYLLDELSGLLQAQGVENYWLSLGGDILCAGLDEPGTPWKIAIQDALHEGVPIASATNGGKLLAVATSGVTKRKGVTKDGAWHHIMDPRTNRPAVTDVLTATVCGPSATETDVFAKCLAIVGSTRAGEFMKKIGQKDALLQLDDGDGSVRLQKVGTVWSA